jgi:mannose-6-phosphate isomerase
MRPEPRAAAQAAAGRLKAWLADAAYPVWAEVGFDPATGRFREKIAQDGVPLDLPSRGRVPPRQIYAFSVAPSLGWTGDAAAVVRQGLQTFLRDHQRTDGLIRPLGSPDDGASDARPVELYDQAFALFGLAAAHPFVDGGLERAAIALRLAIRAKLSHPAGGFQAAWPPRTPLESNPHMHLFEACLAWAALSPDPAWQAMAEEIVDLARSRFIDPQRGVLREFFADDWRPAEGLPGRIVEPGHQFEWAWLLLQWSSATGDTDLRRTGLRLIELAETHGVDADRGVAVDALLEDHSLHAPTARLWPQTERLKAAALAARLTGDPAYWTMAARAAEGLELYFDTPVPGLWRDRMTADGAFVEEPAPASSLYHIVLAVAVLAEELAATA